MVLIPQALGRCVFDEWPRTRCWLASWVYVGCWPAGSPHHFVSGLALRMGQFLRCPLIMQSLRHSPISPVHDHVDRDIVHSATTIHHRLDSTALPHSALSPPIVAIGHSPGQVTSSAVEAEQRLHSQHIQAGRTGTKEATRELAGEIQPHGHTAHHSPADLTPNQQMGVKDTVTGQGVNHEAHLVAQKPDSMADRSVQQAPEAGCSDEGECTKPGSDSMLQESDTSVAKQMSLTDPPTAYQGRVQHSVLSPEAAAPQQAAGQAAQHAGERLRELVIGADYSEKDWYYVDPQVIHLYCQPCPWHVETPIFACVWMLVRRSCTKRP